MQSSAAMMRATQLTPIGISCVPTITLACLRRRTAWPMANRAKISDATRKPVRCEFMSHIFTCRSSLCQQNTVAAVYDRRIRAYFVRPPFFRETRPLARQFQSRPMRQTKSSRRPAARQSCDRSNTRQPQPTSQSTSNRTARAVESRQ